MKFLADMGISPRGVAFPRSLGVEAIHVHEPGLERLPDAQIVEMARPEGTIVLTHDLDSGELLALTGADLPSVVIFRLQSMRPSKTASSHRECTVDRRYSGWRRRTAGGIFNHIG